MTVFIPEPRLLDSPRGRHWPGGARVPAARTDPPPTHADVVVVGAGPAGLAVASALWHLGVRDVVLLDRARRPAGRFFARIDAIGQRVLRSPYHHHPGVEGYRDCELLDFVRLHWAQLTAVERREIRMAQAGHRSVVPVDAFEAYCRHVAVLHQVDRRTWRTAVREVAPQRDRVVVRTDSGAVTARHVVLCLGEERRAAPGHWWDEARPPARVSYWDAPAPRGGERVIVVGGGLTAAHLITNALTAGQRVHWLLREGAERYQCADVNAAFFRAEGRLRFETVGWADRLRMMRQQRRASVMFEFRPLLRAAAADGRLTIHGGRSIAEVRPAGEGTVRVRLRDGERVEGDHAVLALGTTVTTGERLLPASVVRLRDGWPDLDERTLAFRAAPRVFAIGAAACMALGPAARNIDGHRVAAARVAPAIAAELGA
ncbi:NAD(P)-binding domain-containing protein [Actinomycetes bacterium KLBMP 9797]